MGKTATNIDVIIGKNLRTQRELQHLSQDKLAKSLPVPITFQQIQKYEKGMNRISASTLYEIAAVMKLELKTFFNNIEEGRSL